MEGLSESDFERAARKLGVRIAAVKAVAEVESNGSGFLADGRPQILFEAHVFHRLTHGRHAGKVDRNGRALSSLVWDRSLYGPAGSGQHDRLADAAQLDWGAAHRSASWGKFQILGSNYRLAGFDKIEDFVAAMHRDVKAHFDAFIGFIKGRDLAGFLKRQDWTGFARRFNGPNFAKHRYDTRLAQAYQRFERAKAA